MMHMFGWNWQAKPQGKTLPNSAIPYLGKFDVLFGPFTLRNMLVVTLDGEKTVFADAEFWPEETYPYFHLRDDDVWDSMKTLANALMNGEEDVVAAEAPELTDMSNWNMSIAHFELNDPEYYPPGASFSLVFGPFVFNEMWLQDDAGKLSIVIPQLLIGNTDDYEEAYSINDTGFWDRANMLAREAYQRARQDNNATGLVPSKGTSSIN